MGDRPVLADAKATLSFIAGTASGSSGCNTFTGPYQVNGPSMAIGLLASTRMACPDPVMVFEQRG
jgi:heat shock protein HslJ